MTFLAGVASVVIIIIVVMLLPVWLLFGGPFLCKSLGRAVKRAYAVGKEEDDK